MCRGERPSLPWRQKPNLKLAAQKVKAKSHGARVGVGLPA